MAQGQDKLGDLLRGVLRRYDLERRLRQRAAMDLWPQVVGADIARNCWPQGVRDGVLAVLAANHAWAQTLHLMRTQIIEALNARAGEQALRDITVRVGDRGQRPPRAGAADAPPPAPELPPLTRDEQERVRRLTASIADPGLRLQVQRAVVGIIRRRRQREQSAARVCPACGRPLPRRWPFRVARNQRRCPACAARR